MMCSVAQGEPDEVTICSKDHNTLLVQGLRQLLQEEYLVDANVVFKGTCFKVHRLILAVFLPTLKVHMNDANPDAASSGSSQMLSMDYVASDANDVRTLLDFLYSGSVTIERDRMEHVGQLAKDLNVDSLAQAIDDWERTACQAGAGDASSAPLSDINVASNEATSSDSGENLDVGVSAGHMSSVTNQAQNGDGPSKDCAESPVCAKADSSTREVPSESTNVSLGTCKQPSAAHRKGLKLQMVKKFVTLAQRRKQIFWTGRRRRNDETSEESSESEQEDCKDDSDWLPGNSGERMLRRSFRKPAAAVPACTRYPRASNATSENTSDQAKVAALQTSGEQVPLQTSEDVVEATPKESVHFERRVVVVTVGSAKRSVTAAGGSAAAVSQPLTCDRCKQKFLSARNLHAHTKRCHFKKHVCQCGYRAVTRADLRQHCRTHVKKVPMTGMTLSCSQCNYTCKYKHTLRDHILRRHTAEREHKCPECEYSAIYKGEIDRHVSRAHRKESMFVCDMCGARYQMRGSLNMHMLIVHQGIKPFKCEHCEKEFTKKPALKLHVQLKHTLDAPRHVCDICGSSYIKRWGLQYHMRRAHGTSLEPLRKPYAPRIPPVQQEQEKDAVILDTLLPGFENVVDEMCVQNMETLSSVNVAM